MNDTDTRDWRELEVEVRPSSVSDYQMVADANITYGVGATTYGKIYAGIDGNGVAHSVQHDETAYGDIYAEGNVTGNTTMMNGAQKYNSTTIRSVIKSPINFNSFLASLVDIRNAAGAGGIVEDVPTVDAWKMTFQSNGQVFVQSCTKTSGKPIGDVQPTCGASTPLNIPNNGAIYTGQPVIVSGVVNGRVTIGSASDIYVGGNISYAQDGDDVLGLVSSHSVIVAQWVPTVLSRRAATIAQSGTWRSYGFDPQTGSSEPDYVGNFKLTSATFTGSTATYGGGSMGLFNSRVYPVRQHARVSPAAVVPNDPGRVHGRALPRSRSNRVLSGRSRRLGSAKRVLAAGQRSVAVMPKAPPPAWSGSWSTTSLVDYGVARGGETALSPQRKNDHDLRRTKEGVRGGTMGSPMFLAVDKKAVDRPPEGERASETPRSNLSLRLADDSFASGRQTRRRRGTDRRRLLARGAPPRAAGVRPE